MIGWLGWCVNGSHHSELKLTWWRQSTLHCSCDFWSPHRSRVEHETRDLCWNEVQYLSDRSVAQIIHYQTAECWTHFFSFNFKNYYALGPFSPLLSSAIVSPLLTVGYLIMSVPCLPGHLWTCIPSDIYTSGRRGLLDFWWECGFHQWGLPHSGNQLPAEEPSHFPPRSFSWLWKFDVLLPFPR